jgi:hypothetical protein
MDLAAVRNAGNACAACGHQGTGADPLVLADGHRIHVSHVLDAGSGFYGVPFQAVAA